MRMNCERRIYLIARACLMHAYVLRVVEGEGRRGRGEKGGGRERERKRKEVEK